MFNRISWQFLRIWLTRLGSSASVWRPAGIRGIWAVRAVGLLAALLPVGAVLLTTCIAQEPVPKTQMPPQEGGKERVDRYSDALPSGAVIRLGTERYRFGGQGVAFLPDNKTVVSIGDGKAITFWEAETGRWLREISTSPFSPGQAISFSRDAKRLAVSGFLPDDKSGWRSIVRVYDTASGQVVRTFEVRPRDGILALALNPNGDLLFTIGQEGNMRIEEVATGVELLRQKFPGRDNGASLALSPDGAIVALSSGPNTRNLFVWRWQAAEEPRDLKTPRNFGRGVAFAPDGKLLLADCNERSPTVFLWDVGDGRLLHKLELPDHENYRHTHVAFSPDGKTIAASGTTNNMEQGGAVHLWDASTGRFLRRLDLGSGPLAFSPNGKLLAAGTRIWDFAAGKELSANDKAHRGAVECIVTGGDNLVVTAAYDHTIRIWDAATGQHQRCLTHDGWIRDLALSPDGGRLVSSSLDDTVCLWDVATGRNIYRLAGHGRLGGRRAVAFAPDGKSFLAWGDDMDLRRWDVRTGKAILEHAIRPTGIKVPAEDAAPIDRNFFDLHQGRFTADGKQLILQARDDFFVIDSATGKERKKFPTDSGYVIELAVSPDSKLLLASAWGKPVQMNLPDGGTQLSSEMDVPVTWWDLATLERLGQILLPPGGAGPVVFAPDGKSFALASSKPAGCIRLVETATGREIRKIAGFRSVVRSLAFMPDGKRLVSGMEDGAALIWDLTR
jgi:WD40 repeat protein